MIYVDRATTVFGLSSGLPGYLKTSIVRPVIALLLLTAIMVLATPALAAPAVPEPVNFGYQNRAYSIPAGNFARSSDMSGDTVVTGNNRDDTFFNNAGIANVYVDDGTGVLAPQQTLSPSDAAGLQGFGAEVQVSGDTIAVWANGTNATYIFDRVGTSWSETKKLVGVGNQLSLDGDTLSAKVGGTTSVFYRNEGGADNWGVVQSGIAGSNGKLSGDTLAIGSNIHYRNQGGADNWGLVTAVAAGCFSTALDGDILAHESSDDLYICERDFGGADNWGLAFTTEIEDLEAVAISGTTVVVSVMPGEPYPMTEQYFAYYRKVGGIWQEDQTAFTALSFGILNSDKVDQMVGEEGTSSTWVSRLTALC